jgi:hypothetical protein
VSPLVLIHLRWSGPNIPKLEFSPQMWLCLVIASFVHVPDTPSSGHGGAHYW